MKIFIGFGYNDADSWIKDYVFKLVSHFGWEIVTGEDLYGNIITDEVTNRIKGSDGMLAFLTKRDLLGNGKYSTHPWVRDELVTAISNKIPAVEIREVDVEVADGIPTGRQRITFKPQDKENLILELVRVFLGWKSGLTTKRMLLQPHGLVSELRPIMSTNALRCTYQFYDSGRESSIYDAKLVRIGQGVCIDVKNIPSSDSLIQLAINGPGFQWSSSYESVDLLTITLEKSS